MMRMMARRLIHGTALILVLPLALVERSARSLVKRDVFFNFHGQLLSLIPGKTGSCLRTAYYHLTTQRCPLSVSIGFGAILTHSEVELGESVYIGARCMVGMANIGDHTMLSDDVHVLSGSHQHGTEAGVNYQEQEGTFTQIRIGRNCWIGTKCIIMADIGENSIIGAASAVIRAIPADCKAVGTPARPISQLISE
jgi:virginiamycin A acetyltransferase